MVPVRLRQFLCVAAQMSTGHWIVNNVLGFSFCLLGIRLPISFVKWRKVRQQDFWGKVAQFVQLQHWCCAIGRPFRV